MSTATSASAFDRMEHSVRALDIDFSSQEFCISSASVFRLFLPVFCIFPSTVFFNLIFVNHLLQ